MSARFLDWTNVILGAGDPDFGGTLENLITVALEMFAYAQALGEARLAEPNRRPHQRHDAFNC